MSICPKAAFDHGNFAVAETEAGKTLAAAHPSAARPDVAARFTETKALHLMAFAAARRHDLKRARDRFARARAEAEYTAFLHDYPDSPLVAAAVKRISWLHGGNIPKAAEAAWEASHAVAIADQKRAQRDASLCGPKCLAELLRRAGRPRTVEALAAELHTSDQGTTLLGLQAIARRHGFPNAQGVALTLKGLSEQSLPVIARVEPGHYVIVECLTGKPDAPSAVRIWDPDAPAFDRGGERIITAAGWKHAWPDGIALRLQAAPTARIAAVR